MARMVPSAHILQKNSNRADESDHQQVCHSQAGQIVRYLLQSVLFYHSRNMRPDKLV